MSATLEAQTLLPPTDAADIKALSDVLPAVSPAVRNGLSALVEALSSGVAVRIEPLDTLLTTERQPKS